jgi:transcriptional regulator with XRE-family HTH domain
MRMKRSWTNQRASRGRPIHGPLLRYLRNAYDLTQEELGWRAGVSDRLVRLAESGHSLALNSIQVISEFFDVPATALMSDAASARTPNQHLLSHWLAANWAAESRVPAQELLRADVVLHCEEGTLRTTECVCGWIGKRQRNYGPAVIALEEFSEDIGQTSSCRWRLFYCSVSTRKPITSRVAMTTVRGDGERIGELWEFWASNNFVMSQSD